VRKIILVILILLPQKIWALKSSEIIIEAQSAFASGNLFNASRYYTLAVEKTPDALETKDVENLVISQYITMAPKDFVKNCREESSNGSLKVEFRFYCAKTLIHNEKYVEATDFLEDIPAAYQRLEYHLLKASLLLNFNRPEQCLTEMAEADKKVTEKTSSHFQDLMKVVKARCFLAQDRYQQGLTQFQALSVNSDFYLTTLEEQAWAQFKARNLASSREILKILISYFTSQNQSNQIFGADLYFRTKYLQSYIELISENREKARDMFSSLKAEIQKFKKTNFAKMTIPKNMDEQLKNLSSTLPLLSNNFEYLRKFREFIGNWGATDNIKQLDNHVRNLVALNQELRTLAFLRNGEFDGYARKVKKLRAAEIAWIHKSMFSYFSIAKRNIESLEFKANMGQVENFWADRTEGKRTLADVLEAYKNEVSYVEDRIGN
jgi:hypothetical protein